MLMTDSKAADTSALKSTWLSYLFLSINNEFCIFLYSKNTGLTASVRSIA